MTAVLVDLQTEVRQALDTVIDPELDQPITQLGFVRSVLLTDDGVEVHLRLPTSFCAPNFAYLMCSDAQDALRRVPDIGTVVVELDDHHDSDKINTGLAANAGYRGTFGVEALDNLDELRLTFQRKAHTAAMERSVSRLLKTTAWTVEELGWLTVADLPSHPTKEALLRRRLDIGLGIGANALVLVDDSGEPIPAADIPLRIRLAASVRISIEGNAHFCRGLLATRYADGDAEGITTRVHDLRSVK